MKLQDVKMTDQMTGCEIAGHENDGCENAGHENARHEIAGHKKSTQAANT